MKIYYVGGISLILLDYLFNLAIFSLLVSTPLVIRSLIDYHPFKHIRIWVSIYAGIVSVIIVMFTIHHEGYSYDIRYAPVILVYSYLGPVAGFITGTIALCMRLYAAGNWFPAIVGWLMISTIFTIIYLYMKRYSSIKRIIVLSLTYIAIYIVSVPVLFNVLQDDPMFHFEYLLFVLIGVVLGGLLIESYMKLFRIISEKKEIQAILAENDARFRLITENTSDLILLIDKHQKIAYFSPSHMRTLGYPFSEFENIKIGRFVHPDDKEMFLEKMNLMFEEKAPYTMELRLQARDGRWLNIESRGMPVIGENGKVEHIVLISRDITERVKSEEILLQSEKLSVVGELAAGVAHEIRNPLTTIKGFIQLYQNGNYSMQYNELLLNELERIENITSELLTLGKPQAVQLKRANVQELIENTVDLLTPQAHMNNIQFQLNFTNSDLYIKCERNQIKQVFLNIIKNAIEAMPKGGNIEISVRKDAGDHCVISFQDQGDGIPEEILPRLGEPFYSLKEKGTGLGLMICHKIIKLHNGSITYNSIVNEGTLIEVRLPLEDARLVTKRGCQ